MDFNAKSDTLISPELGTWPIFNPPLRVGVMASGNGSNFEVLVNAGRRNAPALTVPLLVANNANCGALKRAERLAIPYRVLDHRGYTRENLDRCLIQAFHSHGVEAIVMAGWMRIVTPLLIEAFPGRLINIHPSLLPSFRGLDATGQALAAGSVLAGCTAHFVAQEVDAGSIIAQAAVRILPGDDRAILGARIQAQEHRLLPWAVALAGQSWRVSKDRKTGVVAR